MDLLPGSSLYLLPARRPCSKRSRQSCQRFEAPRGSTPTWNRARHVPAGMPQAQTSMASPSLRRDHNTARWARRRLAYSGRHARCLPLVHLLESDSSPPKTAFQHVLASSAGGRPVPTCGRPTGPACGRPTGLVSSAGDPVLAGSPKDTRNIKPRGNALGREIFFFNSAAVSLNNAIQNSSSDQATDHIHHCNVLFVIQPCLSPSLPQPHLQWPQGPR